MSQSTNETRSNPASARSSQDTQHGQERQSTNFAFLVHSKDTFNLPPTVDNKSLARQRRKRTSPEDQEILEAEFLRDPKPDKVRRLDIVQRVALGDKEVQIWFQNRRQSKRRKSLPPLSYDVLPRLEPTPQHSSVNTEGVSDASSSQERPSNHEHVFRVATPATSQSSFSFTRSTVTAATHEDGSPDSSHSISRTSISSSSPRTSPHVQTSPTHDESILSDQSGPRQSTSSQPLGPISLREMPSVPEEPYSNLRLSMTSDGGARIISGTEVTPSPPRSQPLAPTPFATRQTLRRSYSNANARELRERPRNLSQLLRRKSSGRSRDSRAWEFWCDPEARNELIVTAQKDTTGSAVDAIKMIRSNSASRRYTAMTPNARQAGASSSRDGEPGSTGRSSNSGSDKENRSPGDEDRTDSTKEMPLSRSSDHSRRVVLGESQSAPTLEGRKIGLGIQGCSRRENGGDGIRKEADTNDKDDNEVEKFMRGGASSDAYESRRSFGEGAKDEHDDEMDCVAGLLSLSQGNWK